TDRLSYGQPYNAGSGQGVTIAEVIDIIRKATGTNKPIESEAVRVRPNKSEVRELICNTALLTKATGWRPATDLSFGIARTVDWWRNKIDSGTVRPGTSYIR